MAPPYGATPVAGPCVRYSGNATGREHRLADELGRVVERHRAAEKIALRLLDPDRAQRLELGGGLDALRHNAAIGVACEGDQRRGERPTRWIEMDMPRQRHVELDHVGTQLQDMLQTGEARTGIVDREPLAAAA